MSIEETNSGEKPLVPATQQTMAEMMANITRATGTKLVFNTVLQQCQDSAFCGAFSTSFLEGKVTVLGTLVSITQPVADELVKNGFHMYWETVTKKVGWFSYIKLRYLVIEW